MYREKKRYGQDPTVVVRSAKQTFNLPLKHKEPHCWFTCSWSDFLNPEADEWRPEAWDIMRRTPQHLYLVLTKLPGRFTQCLPLDWGQGYPNVWLGTTIEDERYLRRVLGLIEAPAVRRFLSLEPLLSAIYFGRALNKKAIQWVITGGESDPTAPRPMELEWVRDIHNQCKEAGIAHFHKQHGGSKKIDGVWGGHKIDGQSWHEFPEVPCRP